MAFWGLYGGLEDKLGGSSKPSSTESPVPSTGAKVTQSSGQEPAAKKQKIEVPASLVPRSALVKKPGPSLPAPRNAILAQKGLKPVTNVPAAPKVVSAPTPTKDVIQVTASIPLVSYEDTSSDAPVSISDSTHITKYLSEIKNLYDPLKPNDYHEYLKNREMQVEMQRQEDFKALVSNVSNKTHSAIAPPASLTSSAPPAPIQTPVVSTAKSPLFNSPFPTNPPSSSSSSSMPSPPPKVDNDGFLKPPPVRKAVSPERNDGFGMGLGGLGGGGQMSVASFMGQDTGSSTASTYNDDDDIDGVPVDISKIEDPMDVEIPAQTQTVVPMGPPPSGVKGKKKLSIAEQMMMKMGWKGMGHGIGKNEQGIAEPIIMQSTGVAGQGIIIGPRLTSGPLVSMPDTKVIILTNMVGPGEVDDVLLAETAEECQRYGRVVECEVRETKNVAPEVAVQIFIKFSTKDEAFKALCDLDGRIFGGRTVRADPFDEFKFDRRDFEHGGILTGYVWMEVFTESALGTSRENVALLPPPIALTKELELSHKTIIFKLSELSQHFF